MKYINPEVESSYRDHDIGRTFYDLVLELRPKKIIEFGVLYGYSTIAMAMALDEIGGGEIVVYDLFEDFTFKHSAHKHTPLALALAGGLPYYADMVRQDAYELWQYLRGNRRVITKAVVEENLKRYGVEKYVRLEKKDFLDWVKEGEQFDLLHVDVSNAGDTIQLLAKSVAPQMAGGATVIFEGGIKERDEVEWVKRYQKVPMTESGVPYVVINPAFPGLSRLTNP